MRKIKIFYIDENNEDMGLFLRTFSGEFDIVSLEPDESTTIEEIIQNTVKSDIDIVIVDYDLKETKPVTFNGDELIKSLHDELYKFPAYILTAYEDRAIESTDEDDIVFDKENALSKKPDIFKKRIKSKVGKYLQELSDAENGMISLLAKKSKEGLNATEYNTLVDYDDLLEKSRSKKTKLAEQLKIDASDIKKLLDLTQEIKKELKDKK